MGLLLTGALPAIADDRALLIGVSRHDHFPVFDLAGPKNDLPAMEKAATGLFGIPGDNVLTLADGAASLAAIVEAFETHLIAGTKAGDRVVFYFSGHGSQVNDINGDETTDRVDEILVTADLEVVGEGGKTYRPALVDDQLADLLSRLKGREVIVIIDACHSGTATRSLSDPIIDGARFLPHPARLNMKGGTRGVKFDTALLDRTDGVTVWSAAGATQLAWDDTRIAKDADRRGVFTTALLEGLGGAGDANEDGLVSNAELLNFVRVESEQFCESESRCRSLTPTLEISDDLLSATMAVKPKPKPKPKPNERPTEKPQPKADPEPATPAKQQRPKSVFDRVTAVVTTAQGGKVDVGFNTDGTTLKAGQVFRVRTRSTEAGDLYLFDVTEDGDAVQLFPNEVAKKITSLRAHKALTIPDDYYGFEFEAEGPSNGMLVAIVATDNPGLDALAGPVEGFEERKADEVFAALIGRLQALWTDDVGENRATRYSIGTLRYRVEK